jgi:hypothetical protein
MMQSNYDSIKSKRKYMKTFPNGTHNETFQNTGYYETIKRFIDEISERKIFNEKNLIMEEEDLILNYSNNNSNENNSNENTNENNSNYNSDSSSNYVNKF